MGDKKYVPAIGARRRIEALAHRGYSGDDLYALLVPGAQYVPGGWARGQRIASSMHEAIHKLYEQLWNTEGPSPRVKEVARRNCWGGPWDWEPDEMDDPDSVAFCCMQRLHVEGLKMNAAMKRAAKAQGEAA